MLAMTNILFHKKSRYTTQSGNNIEARVSVPTRPQNLSQLGWVISDTNSYNIRLRGFDTDFWRTAAEVAIQLEIKDFIDALAVFVRESRKRFNGVPNTNASIVRRESDSSWVEGMLVALHPSIRCWRRKGNDSNNLELLTKEYVCCKQSWQRGKEWRRDYVWVQDTKAGNSSPLDGRKVGQVQAIITVIDDSRHDSKGAPVQYTGVFIDLLHFRNNGQVHKVHGMVEVEDWPQVRTQNPRNIGHRYFFDMSTILRSAHIIPTDSIGLYYINNYVDWDQYNTIFDPEFLINGIRDADRIATEYRHI